MVLFATYKCVRLVFFHGSMKVEISPHQDLSKDDRETYLVV